MKQTTNYQLNQWERSDRILMEDFNADNAKIDAAFALHPSAEFLLGGIVETAAAEVELDVSSVDWGKYFLVILEVESMAKTDLYLRTGLSGECYLGGYFPSNTPGSGALMRARECARLTAIIPTLYRAERAPTLFAFGAGAQLDGQLRGFFCSGSGAYPLSSVSVFRLTNEHAGFLPGDLVKLWGVK